MLERMPGWAAGVSKSAAAKPAPARNVRNGRLGPDQERDQKAARVRIAGAAARKKRAHQLYRKRTEQPFEYPSRR
jgi:hypothetical protein